MDDIDEVSQKLGSIEEKVDNLDGKVDKLSTIDPEDYEKHKEEFEAVKKQNTRHKWYWRGVFTIISVVTFTLSLAWKQILRLF